jgi:hypothetical protein
MKASGRMETTVNSTLSIPSLPPQVGDLKCVRGCLGCCWKAK